MADAKITALTANTTPIGTDIIPMVDDPGGTPLTQKITIANLGATGSGLLLNGFPANATPTANNIPVLDAGAKLPVAAVPVSSWTEVLGGVGFANSWVNYGTFTTAAFYKDAFNIVHLKGFVKNGTVNTAIFTLPSGYRPQAANVFPAINNDAFAEIRIGTDGIVTQTVTSTSSNSWLSLDGITFAIF